MQKIIYSINAKKIFKVHEIWIWVQFLLHFSGILSDVVKRLST